MPKREPKPGESKLVHYTVETNHRAEFALDWNNYAFPAIQAANRMLTTGEVVAGFSLKELSPLPLGRGFAVWYGDTEVSQNKVSIIDGGSTIMLKTSVHSEAWLISTSDEPSHRRWRALQGILAEAADLEQCAAIAIALKQGIIIRLDENILMEWDPKKNGTP